MNIIDGLSGLERVFKEEFTNAKVRRCQVHVARNVSAKVGNFAPIFNLNLQQVEEMREVFEIS